MKLIALFVVFLSSNSFAGFDHLNAMLEEYPWISETRLTVPARNACFLCHQPRSDEHNWYGQHYFETGWYTGQHDFKIIELIDSDNDGYNNIEELRSLTNPGDPKDYPGSDN